MEDDGKKPVQLEYNLPQLLTVMAPQKKKFLEWGRGTGKSTIIAWFLKLLAQQMPRSSGIIVGETYQQILTRTLPSTISSLESLGFKKDLHYFIGRKPPASWKWPEPYEPPVKYDHYMIWYTGAGFHLVSQDRPGSGRSLNIDHVTGDEMTLLDFTKLFNDVLATKRGNIHRFGKCPLHHSELFAGTVPMSEKGKWVYKMEEEARMYPQDVFYLRASAEHNRKNLGDGYFKENKRRLPTMLYNSEILNIRPDKIEGGFYAQLDEEKHTYTNFNYSFLDNLNYNLSNAALDSRQDSDVIHDQPLDIALDYGASINVLQVGQRFMNDYRFVNTFYTKHPLILKDVVNNFCDYYRHHSCKQVNYPYDHTAVGKDAVRVTTFADEVETALKSRGWTVRKHYIGQAPHHHAKYLLWGAALSGDKRMLRPQINRVNSKVLFISMQLAPVKQGRNGFEKDKSSERNASIDQAEATHPSDAADTLLFWRCSNALSSSVPFVD